MANASNYLLDEVFMFRMEGGMAGCGWASVVSQVGGVCLWGGRGLWGVFPAEACVKFASFAFRQSHFTPT